MPGDPRQATTDDWLMSMPVSSLQRGMHLMSGLAMTTMTAGQWAVVAQQPSSSNTAHTSHLLDSQLLSDRYRLLNKEKLKKQPAAEVTDVPSNLLRIGSACLCLVCK